MEVGDDVGELDRALVEGGFERRESSAVVLERDRHQLDPEPLQHQQRAVVGRLLDHDPVAGLEQVLEEHPARLERPVGDHHLSVVEPTVPLCDPVAEARAPDSGPVGECLFPVLGERDRRRVPHRVLGQDVGAGRAREQRKSCHQSSPPTLATESRQPPAHKPARGTRGRDAARSRNQAHGGSGRG